MAYVDDLLLAYKNANAGVAATGADALAIDAFATQVTLGKITATQALTSTLALNNDTSAVALATYQFFTGAAPSEAGLAFFLNSATNANDLNDTSGLYASFNQESRFINFSINLAIGSTSAASFATAYGSVSYRDAVATAYNKIIGNTVAVAAGIDVNGAVDWISRAANISALTQFVKSNNPTFTAAQVDLAVKAALIGQILNIAVSNGLGGYADAVKAALTDLSDDGHYTANNAAGVDLFTAYPSTAVGGTAFVLTTGVDTITGTSANDTVTALIDNTTGAVTTTLTALDQIAGGAGTDTLVLNVLNGAGAAGTAVGALPTVSVSGVETANVRSAVGLTADFSTWSGLTQVNVTQGTAVAVTAATSTGVNISGSTGALSVDGGKDVVVTAATSGQGVTVGATTVNAGSVTVTHSAQAAGAIAVDGGTAVTVTAAKNSGGTITVGNGGATTDLPTGAVSVSSTGAAYVAGSSPALGNIVVKGGTTVSVAQVATSDSSAVATDAAAGTITEGSVSVTGSALTTSVTVTQTASSTGQAYIATAGNKEVQTVTFAAVANGGTVTVNGLTFTAAKALTAAEVASAFANLTAGATSGSAPVTNGTYSGTFNTLAFTTGSAASDVVTLTSTTNANLAAATVAASGTAPTVATVTDGVATAGQAGVLTVAAGAVTINGAITGTDVLSKVTLDGYGATTIASDALTTLSLANSNASVGITNAAATTLGLSLNKVGISTAFAALNLGATYTTLNAAVSGASYANITAGGVEALTVSGSAALNLTGSTFSALKTVAVTGSAGITLDASGATVTSVDTTGTTGASTVTIDATKATYTGGAGVDTVTLSTTAPTKAVSLGAGDDTLTLASGTGSSTANLSGGDGTDTLAVTAADAATLSASNTFETKIDAFEKLSIGALTAGASATVDLANLDDISYVITANANGTAAVAEKFTADWAGSGAIVGADTITFDGTTVTLAGGETPAAIAAAVAAATYADWTATVAGTVVTFTAKVAGTKTDTVAGDFSIVDAGATGTQPSVAVATTVQGAAIVGAGTLTLNNLAAASTVEITAAGAGVTANLVDATGTSDVLNVVVKNGSGIAAGTVTAAGVETINLTATDTTTSSIGTHSVTLADAALKTVTIGGNAGLSLTYNSTALTSVNASANTGGVTVSTLAGAAAATTVTGGTGADTLTANHANDVLVGGAGADTLTVGAATANLVTLTGGAGADTFVVGQAVANVNSYATITDAAAGDVIKLFNTGATETFTSAKLALGDTAVFQDYANLAIASTDTGAITWFQYGGNTYIVENVSNDASAFTNATDVIVKLTGLVDLSTASFSSSTQTVVLH